MAEATATRIRVAREISRDRLGHWVKPPSAAGKPCPHKCCQGKRTHPKNLPVRLDRDYLRSLSEDELVSELENYQRYSDTHEAGYLQILAEDQRRTATAARKERAREKRDRENSEYRDEVYRQWFRAENGIQGGVLLNKAGRAADIDDRSLFTGPQSRVNKYASDELKEWFQSHPRMTRAQWDADRRAEEQAQRQTYRKAA